MDSAIDCEFRRKLKNQMEEMSVVRICVRSGATFPWKVETVEILMKFSIVKNFKFSIVLVKLIKKFCFKASTTRLQSLAIKYMVYADQLKAHVACLVKFL
jgi:hypothetical protein